MSEEEQLKKSLCTHREIGFTDVEERHPDGSMGGCGKKEANEKLVREREHQVQLDELMGQLTTVGQP